MIENPRVSVSLGKWRGRGFALQVELAIGGRPREWTTIMTTEDTRREWNLSVHEAAEILNKKGEA